MVAEAELVFETDTELVRVVDPVDDLDLRGLNDPVKDTFEVNEGRPVYDRITVELCELMIEFVSEVVDDQV